MFPWLRRILEISLLTCLGAWMANCAYFQVCSVEPAPRGVHGPARQALVILPGVGIHGPGPLGGPAHARGIRAFARTAGEQGYDVLLPAQSRKSVQANVQNLRRVLTQTAAHEYERVHFITYILGGRVLNAYLRQYPMPNLGRVIYDRSPIQEWAPAASHDLYPSFVIDVLKGPIVREIKDTSYRPLPADMRKHRAIRVGLIIENSATPFMKNKRKLVRKYRGRKLNFAPTQFKQAHDDFMHTRLNHDQMYTHLGEISGEIFYFLEHGRFSPTARRVPLGGDPYQR